MMTTNGTVLGWHFLKDDGRMRYGTLERVEAGKTYMFDGEPFLCECGLHASVRAIDALGSAPGSMVCRVEVGGQVKHATDKLVGTERTVLWMADATPALHEFSAWAAEWILDKLEAIGKYTVDPRSRAAITAKRRWLKGEITDIELAAAGDVAWDATWDAAWDATWAARDAARAATRAAAGAAAWDATWAARDAAGAATWAATWAARDATWDVAWAARAAARAELNRKLEEMLMALKPQSVETGGEDQ